MQFVIKTPLRTLEPKCFFFVKFYHRYSQRKAIIKINSGILSEAVRRHSIPRIIMLPIASKQRKS